MISRTRCPHRIRALGTLPAISEIHTTNGRWDLVVELSTETLTDFNDVLGRVRLIPGIAGSETSLLLATPRSTKAMLKRDAAIAFGPLQAHAVATG